jgi:prephenate dehydrogenase
VRVGIIGTGLIGASIGLACRARGDTVMGFDRDAEAQRFALASGAIGEAASRDTIYATCDAIAIATPVDVTLEEVRSLEKRTFRPGQFVFDVASVKAPVEEAGAGVDAFVPTHPMAGGERSGPAAAREDLFVQRTWCYVPMRDERRTQAARAFIERLGAHACSVDARDHDRIVALTSHVPQLLAFAFTRSIEELSAEDGARVVRALCGPVAEELLRIGRSSSQMWEPIFEANAVCIESALRRLERALGDRRLSG